MTAVNRAWARQRAIADCAAWPDSVERARWVALFGDDDTERVWARETAYQNAGVYSRYFLVTGETTVTPRGLKLFIRLCELGVMRRRCRPRTVAGYVAAIYKMLRLLHPERDYRVLGRLVQRMLALAARTPKLRTAAVADAVDLERFGWRLIDNGRKIRRAERERGMLLFRTGLFILMALYMPERLRAFAALTVDQVNFDVGLIVFRPDQTKNGRESVRPIPSALVPALREWLEMRAAFQPQHGFFWISCKGGGAAATTLYAALRAATSDPRDFAVPVTPHPLRNAAATFIVRRAPEKAPLVAAVLAHRDPRLDAEYTNGAGMIEATRAGGRILMSAGQAPKLDRRRSPPRRYRRGKRVLTPPA